MPSEQPLASEPRRGEGLTRPSVSIYISAPHQGTAMSTEQSDYMQHSDTRQVILARILKKLPDFIEADIAKVTQALGDTPADVQQALTRLMVELRVTSESSKHELDSKERYASDLNAIDKAMDEAGLAPGATLHRVREGLKDSDVISVSRLANPAGWCVMLWGANGFPRKPQWLYGDELTMAQAIQKARA